MENKVKLGYWAFRGYGQTPRLLLTYTGQDWEQFNYTEENGNKWFGDDKKNLGLDFPNLPYLIDGDFKLTQSLAIEKYIIERSENTELLGKNLQDQSKVNQIIGVLVDILRLNIINLFFDKDYQSKLRSTWEKVKPKLDSLEKFIGDKQFTLGYLTLADFYISEYINYVDKLFPEEYKQYRAIQRVRESLNNLEKIKEYYSREDAVKTQFLPSSNLLKY